ncbi:MAG TPA: 2-phosphosulfolactate phosphatase [Solirubrobacterales bacterium]
MIDVAFTRSEIRPARVAVVIDVLRATSTATQALACGYERVLCAESIERAGELRGEGRVLAGERHCVMPEGFDQGNSPRETLAPGGEELVLATTNGAPAIVAAAAVAEEVLLGCLLNLAAVLSGLRERVDPMTDDVQLVCSGTDGAPALEDIYAAGLISAALPGPRSDSALVCEAAARAYPTPVEALAASADATVLRAAGLDADIAHCAAVSRLDCLPTVTDVAAGVATATAIGDRATVIS